MLVGQPSVSTYTSYLFIHFPTDSCQFHLRGLNFNYTANPKQANQYNNIMDGGLDKFIIVPRTMATYRYWLPSKIDKTTILNDNNNDARGTFN